MSSVYTRRNLTATDVLTSSLPALMFIPFAHGGCARMDPHKLALAVPQILSEQGRLLDRISLSSLSDRTLPTKWPSTFVVSLALPSLIGIVRLRCKSAWMIARRRLLGVWRVRRSSSFVASCTLGVINCVIHDVLACICVVIPCVLVLVGRIECRYGWM